MFDFVRVKVFVCVYVKIDVIDVKVFGGGNFVFVLGVVFIVVV